MEGSGGDDVWDALRSGNLTQVVTLFENPTEDLLVLVDQGGNTPLHICAAWGFADITRFLLRKGARVATVNIRGFTPLHWAAMNGHDAVCSLLLEAKSPIREDMVRSCLPLSSCTLPNSPTEEANTPTLGLRQRAHQHRELLGDARRLTSSAR